MGWALRFRRLISPLLPTPYSLLSSPLFVALPYTKAKYFKLLYCFIAFDRGK